MPKEPQSESGPSLPSRPDEETLLGEAARLPPDDVLFRLFPAQTEMAEGKEGDGGERMGKEDLEKVT